MTDEDRKDGLPHAENILNRALFLCLLLAVSVWIYNLLHPGESTWVEWSKALLPWIAAAATISAATRDLPLQNLAVAAIIAGILSTGAEILNTSTRTSYSHIFYGRHAGPKMFGLVPFWIPLLWIVVVLNARGVARLILRPWRMTERYGYWLLGMTCVTAVLFDLSLEPFAVVVGQFWRWNIGAGVWAWYGAPWFAFPIWGFVVLLIGIVISPWMINKRSNLRPPPNYQPLIIWTALLLLFGVGCATYHLWRAAILILSIIVLTGLLAIRGGKREH